MRTLQEPNDNDMKYQGDDIGDIKKGMTFDEVVRILATQKPNKDYIENTYNMGNNISPEAALLSNRYASYKLNNRGIFILDMKNSFTDMPYGYYVKGINATLKGSIRKGNTVIFQTSKSYKNVKIDVSRIPLDMVIYVKIGTPKGDINLYARVHIPTVSSKTEIFQFENEDYTDNKKRLTHEEMIDKMAIEIVNLKNRINNSHIEVPDVSVIEEKYDKLETKVNNIAGNKEMLNEIKNSINISNNSNQILSVCDMNGNPIFITYEFVNNEKVFKSFQGNVIKENIDFKICGITNTIINNHNEDVIICNSDDECFKLGVTDNGETTWTKIS